MLQQSRAAEWHNLESPRPSTQRKHRHPALERLICAAIGDAQLAATLVQTPSVALQRYELGRRLSNVERRLVLAITDADDIAEFAGRLQAMVIREHTSDAVPYDEPIVERALARDTVAARAGASLLPKQ